MLTNLYKAEKGLIKVKLDLENGFISYIEITGDFFMVPEKEITILQDSLLGKKFSGEDVGRTLDEFYLREVNTPSVTKEDIAKAILGAKDENTAA